jgi:hypothetical protein
VQQDGPARLGKPARTKKKELARNQKGNIVRRKKRLENFSSTELYETETQISGDARGGGGEYVTLHLPLHMFMVQPRLWVSLTFT